MPEQSMAETLNAQIKMMAEDPTVKKLRERLDRIEARVKALEESNVKQSKKG